MNIERGLFQFDLTDYHAILGVSLDADAKQIRKRYLKIARKLHPDSLRSSTDEEKQQANELLSKLVNPAYEKLTQEKTMTEHMVVLRLRGQQLGRQSSTLELQDETAKSLIGNNNPITAYTSSLQKLAEEQYQSLGNVLDITGQISELNLAYLVNTTDTAASTAAPTNGSKSAAAPSTASASPPAPKPKAPPSPRQQREAIIDSYLNRARQFALKRDYSRAILEMREVVKAHPTNAQCHSQLAEYYLQAGQPTMARIHLERSTAIDPDNALAKELNAKVSKATQAKAAQSNSKSSQSKSRGGLFGLFGGNQK
ncbi:DnaJ domain-containing protein [Oscillatoria sp. CS-180]|uniref:J domain-containing protein n=1 Tax=Oscillatoria sp. CS-180 TaxID=3021720 RepID=UPI00232C2976|nr:DnaJ domain-containing protein [Oscillatoria sp. CS-180]MDB9527216.1 DnaJ domain-containing protein [Oscillatoria sp. CS-180]